VANSCAKDGRNYGDFLLALTERELIEREQRAAQRRIKSAKFPVIKNLEDFDFDAQPSINETLVRQLATGEYLDGRENVLLIGNSGTGKTHLASALGFTACAQGKRVRFWSATALVTHMLEMREARELKRFFTQLDKHDLLILDELGYVPFSKAGAELLFEVISRAYERLSLIVTTNLPFEQWTEVMGSERLTGALLDRLTHRVHIIEANGESYRLKDARKRYGGRKRDERPAGGTPGLPGCCVDSMSDSNLSQTPGRPNELTISFARMLPASVPRLSALPHLRNFGAQSIQGQLHLLPLVLVCFPGYASTSQLPDPPQAWIPSPWLRAT
jgi:DNA replication protein DnaC